MNPEAASRRQGTRCPGRARLVWTLIGLGLSLTSASAATIATNLTTLPPPPPFADTGFSVLRVFGALTLVIALFLAGVWIYRNWHRVATQRGPQHLRILESRTLGGRHALHVVGYQGQRLLLASSPNGISLVSHLPAGESEPAAGPAASGSNFVQVLQQAIQQKP